MLIDIFAPVSAEIYGAFAIHIENKTISRDELIEKYNPIATHSKAAEYESSGDEYWRLS